MRRGLVNVETRQKEQDKIGLRFGTREKEEEGTHRRERRK